MKMTYALMHNSRGEWWVVKSKQYKSGNSGDILVERLKANTNQKAINEAREKGYFPNAIPAK